jgi:hypothetical protein
LQFAEDLAWQNLTYAGLAGKWDAPIFPMKTARFDSYVALSTHGFTVANLLRLGIAGGYSNSSFNVNERFSTGSSDNYHVAAYGGTLGLRFTGVLRGSGVCQSGHQGLSGAGKHRSVEQRQG